MVLSILGWCVLSVLSIGGTTALAYPTPVDFSGNITRWDLSRDNPSLIYKISSEDDELIATYSFIIEEAASHWTTVTGSYLELFVAVEGEAIDIEIILESELKDAPYSAGYSIFTEYNDDGSPKKCEIHVAADQSSSFRSIGKTTLHEFGHCIGLGHSLIPEAIMSYRLDVNTFDLDIDDEAAISRLYPTDGSTPKLPPGCAITAEQQPGGLYLLLLMLLPLMGSSMGISRSPTSDR